MVAHEADYLDGMTAKEQAYFRRSTRMSKRFPKGAHSFSHANRLVFRLTKGRLGARMLGVPIGLLTTTGRRSGRSRTVPVVYLDEGTRFLVVTSNHGFEVPPAWYLNLQAHPDAVIQTRTRREPVAARELTDVERDQSWARLVAHNPMWGAYQACTKRQLAVVALQRRT